MTAPGARILRGEVPVTAIDPADRGLAYGDGVFETLLVHQRQPVWWTAHWQRLGEGARRLGFDAPAQAVVLEQVDDLLRRAPPRGVLKLVLTRGVGGRGYRPPAPAVPTTVLTWHPAPAPLESVDLAWCQTRWSAQPRLAGIKHLNRLEQVLARAEWSDPGIFDGLVCDAGGQVASATAANVFARIDGHWRTPPLRDCGVAGLARAWLLEHCPGAVESALEPAQVEAADAVFLCNAVRGILPVRRLGRREWPLHPALADLRRRLASAEPAFADPDAGIDPHGVADDANKEQ